jgi:replicative DNA helicase
MLEQNAAGLVIDRLHEDMFYKENHKYIFKAIYEVFETGNPVDLLSVTAQLRKDKKLEPAGGSYYLALLTNKVISSANIEFHARIIIEKHIQRSLISVSTGTIRDAYDDTTDVLELLNKTEQQLFDITEKNFTRNGVDMQQLMSDFFKEIKNAKEHKSELRGVPSGFTDLDRVTGGWQRSNLIILAARPGMGKTGFVLTMARNMAVEYQKPVAFFSLEMSAADLAMRLVSAETGIQIDKLQKAEISDEEMGQLVSRIGVLTEAKLIIDDTPGLTVFDLRAKCRRLKQQHDIQCVVIDYLQLMSGGKENKGNREQEISAISRSLKTLAKELNIPVIALSQLNRSVESRSTTTKRPQLSDLRESGAIEQDADLVLFIYRPEYYRLAFENGDPAEGKADIIIAKHRNGGLADVRLRFIARQAKFCDLETFGEVSQAADHDMNSVTLPSRINHMSTSSLPDHMPF